MDRIISLARHISNNNMHVYLINRCGVGRTPRSFFVDSDTYYHVSNGVMSEHNYPFYVRFFFPGLTKFLQEILNWFLSAITFTSLSRVPAFYVLDPYMVVKLFFVCKNEKVSLIQCELPNPGISSFVVKKMLSIPMVYDAHNIETERVRGPKVSGAYVALTRLLENAVCKMSDSIFAVSDRDRRQLVSRGVPEGKISVIPNSIDTLSLSKLKNGNLVRSKYNLNGKILLIFHGALDYPPNAEAASLLTSTILPMLLSKYPDVYLLLVGENPPKTTQDHVIITGFVENLYDYIAAADIAVVPLLSGGGTRIKIVEYMACGKPIVSTLKGAEGLALNNGGDILMTKRPDSDFVDAILRLILDTDLRKNIAFNARNKAQLLYDWKKNTEKVLETYDKLICTSSERVS